MRVISFAGNTSMAMKPSAQTLPVSQVPTINNGPMQDELKFSGPRVATASATAIAVGLLGLIGGSAAKTSGPDPVAYVQSASHISDVLSRNPRLNSPEQRLALMTQLMTDVREVDTASVARRQGTVDEQAYWLGLVNQMVDGIQQHYGPVTGMSEPEKNDLARLALEMSAVDSADDAKQLNQYVIGRFGSKLPEDDRQLLIEASNRYIDANQASRDKRKDWGMGVLGVGALVMIAGLGMAFSELNRRS